MRRVALGIMVVASVAWLPSAGPLAHANGTADCRDEPTETTEQNASVNQSGNELAFVGIDAEYGATGTGVLLCAGVLGGGANVGVVEDPVRGFVPVLGCSSSRPVSGGDCYLDTGGAVVFSGQVHSMPPLDVTPGVHTHYVAGVLTRVGVVDSLVTVLGAVNCTAVLTTVVTENAAAGAVSGSWDCSDGRGGGMTSVRVGVENMVALSGELNGMLQCSFVASSAPPVSDSTLACIGGGAGY